MAWGTLKEVGWVNAFTSGKYATDNYVKYQIDEPSRKLRVIVSRQRVRSLNSSYSYSGNVNNGCQFLGGGKDSQYPGEYDTEDTISVSGGGSTLIPSNSDRTIGRVYTYNNDGSVPSITLSTQMIFDMPGYDPNVYGFSQQNWKSQELKSKFPTIAKKAPNPVTNLTVAGVTTSTISISFTASSDASSYLVDWGTVNSTDETEDDMLPQGNETITDTTYTITNLDKNQLYLIMVTSLGSDGTGENSATAYGKTLNIDPVTNVSVTEVSTTSITVKFDYSQYAIKYSAIAISTDDSISTTVSTSPATITGLSPNTKYKVGVSAIGTNNDMSDYVYVDNVTTLAKKINPVTDLQVTKITDTSISISFTGSEGAVKYKITIEEDGTTNLNELETTDTKVTITDLSPGTPYNIGVCAVDSSGIESTWVEIDYVTTNIPSPVMVNVDGIVKQVIFAYINVNGVAKDVMAIYVNVNGTAKRVI